MFSKVKKLGSKLFGEKDEEDGGLRSPPSATKMVQVASKGSYTSRKSDAMDVDSSGSFTHKVGTAPQGYSGQQGEATSPSKQHHLVLPPVQVHGQAAAAAHHGNNGANPPSPPAVVAGVMPPTGAGGSGRRKSTPAALDMALRTAEGKAAIEELINSAGKKQMVFGQYFGGPQQGKGPSGPSSAAAAAAAADKSRFGKVAAVPGVPAKSMHTVMEDEEAHHPHAAGASSGPSSKHAVVPSPKAVVPTSGPTSPSAAAAASASASHLHHATAAAAPQHPPQHAPMDGVASASAAAAGSSSRPVATPQKRPAESPKSMAMQVDEVPPARPTKILSMMQQLPTGMARKYWSLADYSILRKMYTGYASTVYQATCKKSLEQVALKVYHMENLCELNHYQVYREIRVHSALSHQHIIQLFCAFQEGNDVVMVQEYAEGGDLYRLLHRNGGRLSERQAVEMVLHPFLLSLHYLHTRGIMHRDIKPENVLFTEHRVLKLADFGLAIDLTEERAVTRAGTLDYMAPEVLRCPPKNLPQENKNNVNLHYNNSVDAWAVGVFAFELIVGFPPFAGESQLASVDKIIHATPEFPEKISELAKAFITAALKKHPGDRPTVMEMLHHPWIRTYQRRTSVLMPQMMRRRSSVQHQSGVPGGLQPQPEEGPLPGAPDNLDNMTPEEIEKMIQRLQMAKHGVM